MTDFLAPALSTLGVFTLILLIRFWHSRPATEKEEPVPPVGQLSESLEEAERQILEGDLGESATILNRIKPAIDSIQGPDGARLRAWQQLACSEHAARAGQRERARDFLERALAEIGGAAPGEDRTEFEIRIDAAIAFLATPEDPDPFYLEHAERALARADQAQRPDTVLALVWAAARVGDYHQGRGAWNTACAWFDRAFAWTARLDASADRARSFWTKRAAELMCAQGRATAAVVGIERAEAAWAVGDRDDATSWFDRSIALVDSATIPVGRFTLARALVARGQREPTAGFADIGPRIARLERAVREAIASELPAGRALASDAELMLAALHASAGSDDRGLVHARRAQEHVSGVAELEHWPQAMRALLQEGALLRDRGGDEALAPLARALEMGRHSPNPEVRHLSANAAHQLHALQLDRSGPAVAGKTLEVLDEIVPALEPQARGLFAIASARAHVHQAARGADWPAARAACDRAEALLAASEMRLPQLARALAMDRADIEAAIGEPEDALPHYQRAVAMRTEPDSPPDEMAERAEAYLKLARALLGLERLEEAWTGLERAYGLGRDSGRPDGRESAAIAALIQGDLSVDRPEERRRLYTTAMGLARLSHSRRGAEIGAAARLRLNELAGREPKDP